MDWAVYFRTGLFMVFCFLAVFPTVSDSAADEMRAKESALAGLINEQRAAQKLQLLSVHPALSSAAYRHAADMARGDFLDHAGSSGDTVRERIEQYGYPWRAYGEIIGREHLCKPKEMIALWLRSPQHAVIMLSADYREFGIAGARQPGIYGSCYWTVVFGSRTASKKGAR
ncbi:MAG TPA: CAP domain-containing protein [Dissulfurispiraceae bacterium]|nr:CAP domain-containing protein [Dissulfurispiraceae bacterium]